MKKCLCIILTCSLLLSLLCFSASPVFAESSEDIEIVLAHVLKDGSYEEVASDGYFLFYYSENDTVRKSATYCMETGRLSYASYMIGDSTVYSGEVYLTKFLSATELCNYSVCNNSIVSKPIPVQSLTKQSQSETHIISAIPQKYLDAINNELFGNMRQPKPFVNGNTRPVVVSGTAVLISDSLKYMYEETFSDEFAAGVALTIISALLGLSANNLIKIVSVVVGVGGTLCLRQYRTKPQEN